MQAFQTATRYEEAQAVWVKEQENKGAKDADAVVKKVSFILNETIKLRSIP